MAAHARAPGRERPNGSRGDPTDLEQVLDKIDHAAAGTERVSFGDVFHEIGERSFGPLLLVPGLIILAPLIGDIPGVPTAMAVVVLLIAGQIMLRREHFWLPRWMLDRSIAADKVTKATRRLRKPARFVDRFLRPRLERFVIGVGQYTLAAAAALVALFTPVMEVVPFSANGAGAALTAFGLALIARDGLLACIGLAMAALTAGAVVFGIASV